MEKIKKKEQIKKTIKKAIESDTALNIIFLLLLILFFVSAGVSIIALNATILAYMGESITEFSDVAEWQTATLLERVSMTSIVAFFFGFVAFLSLASSFEISDELKNRKDQREKGE